MRSAVPHLKASAAWRHAATLLLLCAALLSATAQAQTRAWLDRDRIALGETVTLNVETTEPAVRRIDFGPLDADFEITGQSSRQSIQLDGGTARTRMLFAVALAPRRSGSLRIPSLPVGTERTEPLLLQVAAAAAPVRGSGEIFIESATDSPSPWVQQAVGHVVRLYTRVPLLSGSLEQDTPEGASLRRVGDDAQYVREVGGVRYSVLERRYLLIPERSGTLRIPAARFSGQSSAGWFDRYFGDGRRNVRAEGGGRSLQVNAPPANAPDPWLPLRSLRMRWLDAPSPVAAGEAARVTLEVEIDGAQAAQLPSLELPRIEGVQVFAEPVQVDEDFVDGRPRLRVLRSYSLLAEAGGDLNIPGPRIDWWDVQAGLARSASVPALQWQVGAALSHAQPGAQERPQADDGGPWVRLPFVQGEVHGWSLAAALFALLWLATFIWALLWRRSHRGSDETPTAPDLRRALALGDLGQIEQALLARAKPPVVGIDALAAQLADPGQRQALALLQAARWHGGDADAARRALRTAFAKDVPRQRRQRGRGELLPPLYPS